MYTIYFKAVEINLKNYSNIQYFFKYYLVCCVQVDNRPTFFHTIVGIYTPFFERHPQIKQTRTLFLATLLWRAVSAFSKVFKKYKLFILF